jgi:hypothetical protein
MKGSENHDCIIVEKKKMDYGNMIGESFEYAKEAVMEKWTKWILLAIPFMTTGYSIQVYKGIKPAPEVNDWVANFIDGIKLFIVGLIYAIPLIILAAIFFIGVILAIVGAGSAQDASGIVMGAIGAAFIGIVLFVIFLIAILLLLPIAYVRFARTDSFGEAFNISAILAHIGKIGWVSYIIALIVGCIALIILEIIIMIPYAILMMIPFVGYFLAIVWSLIMAVPVGIFGARYVTQIYDSVAA